jgi:hypothetical protein
MKMFLPILLIITSCSIFKRSEEGAIRDDASQVFSKNIEKFRNCGKKSNIFEKLQSNRILATLNVQYSENELLQFSVKEVSELPPPFVECLFNVSEKIKWPQTKPGIIVEVSQALYFYP